MHVCMCLANLSLCWRSAFKTFFYQKGPTDFDQVWFWVRKRVSRDPRSRDTTVRTIPALSERILLRRKHCMNQIWPICSWYWLCFRISQVFACRITRAFRKNVSLDSRIPASRSRGMEGFSCEHYVRSLRDCAPGHQHLPRTAMVRAQWNQ